MFLRVAQIPWHSASWLKHLNSCSKTSAERSRRDCMNVGYFEITVTLKYLLLSSNGIDTVNMVVHLKRLCLGAYLVTSATAPHLNPDKRLHDVEPGRSMTVQRHRHHQADARYCK